MIKKWIVPLIAFLLCTVAGYRIRQYNLPSAGTAIPVPTHVVLTLVTDTTRDRPVRLEQDGVFLMSANAWRRGLTSIRSKLSSSLQSGGRVRCGDKVACEWLGQRLDSVGPDTATVIVETAQQWPDEAASDASGEAVTNEEIRLVIPLSSSRKHGLIGGQIVSNGIPINLTSSSTHRDCLLASNDLDDLVLAPLTNKSNRIQRVVGQLKRRADQIAVDLEYADASSVFLSVLKYGALLCLILTMFGWKILSRILLVAISGVMMAAATSTLTVAVVPNIMGYLLGPFLGIIICVIGWKWTSENETGLLIGCLLADLITGGFLGSFAGLGANPVIGARYYGLGNELSALLLGSLICLLTKTPIASVISAGFLALLIGHPALGANGGDMIAVLIGICLFTVIKGGRKARLIAILITLAMGCLVVWDAYLAPESMQSHLGRFVAAKGFGFTELVTSKLMAHLRLMTTSAWGITALISIYWWVSKHLQRNGWKADLSTCVAACLFLLNDSGPISLTLFTLVMMLDQSPAILVGTWTQSVNRGFRKNLILKNDAIAEPND